MERITGRDMTTVRISKEAVEFLKEEGKYSETLADICDRLLRELKALREEKRRQLGNAEASPVAA